MDGECRDPYSGKKSEILIANSGREVGRWGPLGNGAAQEAPQTHQPKSQATGCSWGCTFPEGLQAELSKA